MKRTPEMDARDAKIAQAWTNGMAISAIAEQFGISKARVSSICGNMGLAARSRADKKPLTIWPRWCSQCERRVHKGEATACSSAWCKAVVA